MKNNAKNYEGEKINAGDAQRRLASLKRAVDAVLGLGGEIEGQNYKGRSENFA